MRAQCTTDAGAPAKQEMHKGVGRWNFVSSPTSFSGVTLAFRPHRYRSAFVARQQRTASPVHHADGSITLSGFARRAVIPGLRGKCTHGRSRIAETPVGITRAGRGRRMGVVPQGYMVLASHRGSCERGCGEQCSRQKFKPGHSISPLDVKSQPRLAPLRNGAAIRLFQGNISSRRFNAARGRRVVRSRIPALANTLNFPRQFLSYKDEV
jgi:hypothetical protein